MSTWYAAHVVIYVEFKDEEQTAYPVWENVVLIHANSEEEAFAKAEKKGRAAAGDDGGTFRWAGKNASWVFGGVRKLTLCESAEDRPEDGTELTYTEFRVRSTKALRKLIRSERVGLELRDGFPEEEENAPSSTSVSREPLPFRLLDTTHEAMEYLETHAQEIDRAVVMPYASPSSPANGRPQQEREAGMVLHASDGGLRFISRDVAESLLNQGALNRMRIRIELPQ